MAEVEAESGLGGDSGREMSASSRRARREWFESQPEIIQNIVLDEHPDFLSGGGEADVMELLREALDLTRDQWEENEESIRDLIETGVPKLEALGDEVDLANVFVLMNTIREEQNLPAIEPKEFIGGYESAAAEAYADPEAIEAQKRAMHEFESRITPEITDAERAIYELNRRTQEQEIRGAREAALGQARARGLGGGATEFQAGLAAEQEAAQRRMLEDLTASGMAVERSERALEGFGGLATDIRGGSFDEAFKRGTASDDAQEFNKELEQNWQAYATETEATENRDKWGRTTDIADDAYGVIDDRYTHGVAPVEFERDATLAGVNAGTQGAAATAGQLGSIAGTQLSIDAAKNLDDEDDALDKLSGALGF